jgi:hypothetical protein
MYDAPEVIPEELMHKSMLADVITHIYHQPWPEAVKREYFLSWARHVGVKPEGWMVTQVMTNQPKPDGV